jgi:hypothetical protein
MRQRKSRDSTANDKRCCRIMFTNCQSVSVIMLYWSVASTVEVNILTPAGKYHVMSDNCQTHRAVYTFNNHYYTENDINLPSKPLQAVHFPFESGRLATAKQVPSPLRIRWCVFRQPCWLNDLLHLSQENGLSPLCISWCLFSWSCLPKDLLHISQENGCSPLCMHLCVFRQHCILKDLLYSSQENGCSPVCMSSCLFKSHWILNDLLHSSQQNGRSPVCMGLCELKGERASEWGCACMTISMYGCFQVNTWDLYWNKCTLYIKTETLLKHSLQTNGRNALTVSDGPKRAAFLKGLYLLTHFTHNVSRSIYVLHWAHFHGLVSSECFPTVLHHPLNSGIEFSCICYKQMVITP